MQGVDECAGPLDIDRIESTLRITADHAGGVDDATAACQQPRQCRRVVQAPFDQLHPALFEIRRAIRVADQCANAETDLQEVQAERGPDETGGAGNGDQVAVADQAEATLRRASSTNASGLSGSWVAM